MKRAAVLCALAGLILAAGCSPARKLERLERKHPELFDSIHLIEPVIIPGFSAGTVFFTRPQDTVEFKPTGTKLSIKVIRQGDSLKVSASAPADTIFIDRWFIRPAPVQDRPQPWYKKLGAQYRAPYLKAIKQTGLYFAALLTLVFLLLRSFRRR